MTAGLSIKEVAERTGVAAGTLRMWEQRYGFPVPERTPSGYRRYRGEIVDALRRVVELRERGLSMAAAIERAQEGRELPTDRPSIYGAVAAASGIPRQRLRKSTLQAISRAIEDEALARAAGPVTFGAFQQTRFYAPVAHRYRELARLGDAVTVFADFAQVREADGEPLEVPIGRADALGSEWAVVVDAPGFSACLLGWEPPDNSVPDADRVFEAVWTVDPRVTRDAAIVGARLVGRSDPAAGARLEELLSDRPLATENPAPALTALTNRMLAYVERAAVR
jgi:MerR family transcriptional regulator, light-induced transcriptional regulator